MWVRLPSALPFARVVYVWKGHHVLNMKSSVRLPSAGTNFYGLIHYRLGGLVLNQDGRVRFPVGLPFMAECEKVLKSY